MFLCPYCGLDVDEAPTKEHVLPKKLGGAVEPTNPYVVAVCERCNSRAGREVDGPFIRNWFLQTKRALHAGRYADLRRHPKLPFIWLGRVAKPTWTEKDCELWLSPVGGDAYFHFHDPYPDSGAPAAAGPPANLPPGAYDPGFVAGFLDTTLAPAWRPTLLRSALEQFEGSPIHLVNVRDPPEAFPRAPEDRLPLLTAVRADLGKPRKLEISIPVDVGTRFATKLGLGLGAILLGENFVRSAGAGLLRQYLWERDLARRNEIRLRGMGFFDDPARNLGDLLGWTPGHVVTLMEVDRRLIVHLTLFGEHAGGVCISEDPADWRGKLGSESRVAIVFAPGVRSCSKVVELGHYFAVRQGFVDPGFDEMAALVRRVETLPEPPPARLAEGFQER